MMTLQVALAPLLIIGSFYSLGLFEYPVGQFRPYLSYLYTLATWSLFTYFIYYSNSNYDHVWLTIVGLASIMEFIGTITMILVSWFRFKELKMCLQELSIVDDTLEVLGIPKEYQRLRNWIIRIIIGWIVHNFYQLAGSILIFQYDINFVNIWSEFVRNYPEKVITLNVLISGTILGYTSSRFHQVNDRLHVLCSDLFENNADFRRQNRSVLVRQRIIGSKDSKQLIWIIMHVHLQLCLISRKLNKIFDIQILLHMLWYLLTEVVSFYVFLSWILTIHNAKLWIFPLNFIFLYLNSTFILQSALFLTLHYICQTIYYKINETVAILYKLSNYDLDEDLHEQIQQFILQIKLREVKFGIGYICFGYNSICQLYSTALTMYVILLQLDLVFTPQNLI